METYEQLLAEVHEHFLHDGEDTPAWRSSIRERYRQVIASPTGQQSRLTYNDFCVMFGTFIEIGKGWHHIEVSRLEPVCYCRDCWPQLARETL